MDREPTSQGGPPLQVLAIPGSIRADSLNLRLLEAAAREAAPRAEFEIAPELSEIPCFHPDAEPTESVERLRQAVASADGVLFATPEYNGSIPGGLKNAIDWAAAPERRGPIRGKPVAVIGADRGELGCDWAQADARKVLEVAGARVISAGLCLEEAAAAFADGDSLADPEQARQLGIVLEELIEESLAPG